MWIDSVLVPYRGIYFLYPYQRMLLTLITTWFSSPIGESIFSTLTKQSARSRWKVLVPYRGIYFLYHGHVSENGKLNFVLVPYRGIYFLYDEQI